VSAARKRLVVVGRRLVVKSDQLVRNTSWTQY